MERLDRIEKAIEALQISQMKTDELHAKTELILAKMSAKVDKTAETLSNLGLNLGSVAEEFFFNALKEKPKLGNHQFDAIESNLKGYTKKIQDEFDIVLFNGNIVGLVEVKHKVHPNDIEKLKTKKIENFKFLFPDYANHKFVLGIGGMSIPTETEEQAKAEGIAVLKQKGEIAEIEDEHLKTY